MPLPDIFDAGDFGDPFINVRRTRKRCTVQRGIALLDAETFAWAVVHDNYLRPDGKHERGRARAIVLKTMMRRLKNGYHAQFVDRAGEFHFLRPGKIAHVQELEFSVRQQKAKAENVLGWV